MVFENLSNEKKLGCIISVENEMLSTERKPLSFVLKANEERELGISNLGWSFKSGDIVSIEAKGYIFPSRTRLK